ncbi:hypothetical protein QT231_18290 [Halomonas sp. SpR1]|uniref:hypothetical protein n=1 Tax=Halomonas sp. SpR1 TaxID=3050462 RepID=UPI0027E54C4A|nr:hypothetical protein [Halomonas sp. SpR1]MDQ7734663.1 hypothetical protein [Halomonas sp. SpR1]
MKNRYLDGVAVPDYDEKVTQALADEFPNNDDDENWLSGGFNDFLMGIENETGEVYRLIGLSMSELVGLTNRLGDVGFRDQVGELEGSRRGCASLMAHIGDS